MASPGFKTGRAWHWTSCFTRLYCRVSPPVPNHTDQSLSHTLREAEEKLLLRNSDDLRAFFPEASRCQGAAAKINCFLVSCPELLHNNMGSTHLHTHARAQPHPAEHERAASQLPAAAAVRQEMQHLIPKKLWKQKNKKCGNLRRWATVQSLWADLAA